MKGTSTRDPLPAPPAEDELVYELFPLRSATAVSALLRAINTYPRGTPNRADKITLALPEEGGGFKYYPNLIETLLANLEDTPLAATAAALDLDPTTLILVPSIDQCLLCDGEAGALHIANVVGAKGGLEREAYAPAQPAVMTERGARTGHLYSKKCPCCKALYNMSYASGGATTSRSCVVRASDYTLHTPLELGRKARSAAQLPTRPVTHQAKYPSAAEPP